MVRGRPASGVIEPEGLEALFSALRARGYRVVAPTVRDGAIVYAELQSAAALPVGWTDVQEPGSYRLAHREDEARFGYAVGPHSWKGELLPPRIRLWQARRSDGALEVAEDEPPSEPTAFVGVRACELAAIAIQDRVLVESGYADRDYSARRASVFVVAVNCGEPASTCFCASMDTGPRARDGFDLALTELLDDGHRLLVEAGSDAGAELLAELPARPAVEADVEASRRITDATAERARDPAMEIDLRALLLGNLEHSRWDEVAGRCLTCGNCTMVCPTCFCTTVEDTSDLSGDRAERWRVWDTCYSVGYSELHGGAVRQSPRSRYRQWLTHKVATWHDQFGSTGCVGCGRCITWCPVGIDIREEVRAIANGAEEDGRADD